MAFKEMYPAVPGSPTTTTENTFVAGTTTSITVSQGSVLAAAPNLATITADGRFVTISYTSKSGNTISGLTALEGDKTGTFATGSIIARRYSAVDDSAIKDNITDVINVLPITGPVRDVYVSPSGSDTTGTGTQAKPWREINFAIAQQPHVDANNQYRVHVAAGNYNKVTVSYRDNIVIFIDGTVIINGGNNTITQSKIYIVGETGTDATLNITANDPSSIGIRLHGNSYLHIARLNFNITNVQYGIGSYVLLSGSVGIGMNTLILERAPTNITATSAGIFESQTGLNIYADGDITTNSGIGLRLNGGFPSIGIIKTITNVSGTAYSVVSPAVLSIGGKWVNQA